MLLYDYQKQKFCVVRRKESRSMVIRSFVIRRLPEHDDFGEAITALLMNESYRLEFIVRDIGAQRKGSTNYVLILKRLNAIESDWSGHQIKRFTFKGMTAKCDVAVEGEYVEGWYDTKRATGEVNISHSPPQ